jgi:hypothetical protein
VNVLARGPSIHCETPPGGRRCNGTIALTGHKLEQAELMCRRTYRVRLSRSAFAGFGLDAPARWGMSPYGGQATRYWSLLRAKALTTEAS